MKIAIVYKSLTGNTKLVAQAIEKGLTDYEVVYAGEPAEGIEADLYLVGTWIDKGSCTKEVGEFLTTLADKKVGLFATAGFGGSAEYYKALEGRIKAQVPESNEVINTYFCQGKMPMSVRDRYVAMMQANPEDKNMEVNIKNFDEALSHPDEADCAAAVAWAIDVIKAVSEVI